MIKETVNYTDFNGDKKSEDLYFNMSKIEFIEYNNEMERRYGKGGFEKYLNETIENQDTVTSYELFKDIILRAYGVKSEDGSRFIKPSREEVESLLTTEYFSDFIFELATNEEKAAAFINALIPNEFRANALPDNAGVTKPGTKTTRKK